MFSSTLLTGSDTMPHLSLVQSQNDHERRMIWTDSQHTGGQDSTIKDSHERTFSTASENGKDAKCGGVPQ